MRVTASIVGGVTLFMFLLGTMESRSDETIFGSKEIHNKIFINCSDQARNCMIQVSWVAGQCHLFMRPREQDDHKPFSADQFERIYEAASQEVLMTANGKHNHRPLNSETVSNYHLSIAVDNCEISQNIEKQDLANNQLGLPLLIQELNSLVPAEDQIK